MPYIYSTATCSGTYCQYPPPNTTSGHNTAIRRVTIKGGHGLASPIRGHIHGLIHTPQGVVTQVTQDELDFLMSNRSFLRHMKAGFITVDDRKVDPEKKAASMAQKDGSAPKTPADFEVSEHSDRNLKIYKEKDVLVETTAAHVAKKGKK